MQARETFAYQRFPAGMRLSRHSGEFDPAFAPSREIKIRYHLPEEEIAREFAFLVFPCFL